VRVVVRRDDPVRVWDVHAVRTVPGEIRALQRPADALARDLALAEDERDGVATHERTAAQARGLAIRHREQRHELHRRQYRTRATRVREVDK
jgi:hypothetical protein